ncbi:uncharacterized protein LOC128959187 [Oppia nitens]|uniref:uncharacterized protein LOC128959187 n=1 Tax=Oppia nitens TaxID=1686743 RepID=UPI0023DBF64C|nr:uncharacterized protein LOC128959187 [Oppia nitens]
MAYCAVYLNRISREKNCPEKPEDPLIIEKCIPHDARFSFVDFVPSVHHFSANSQVEYHSFRHLVDTCNVWLKKNILWDVVNCETVKLSYRHNLTTMVSRWEVQTNPAANPWVTPTRGDFETSLKVLRVWIKRRDEERDAPVELKYKDFEPIRKDGSFDNLDDVVNRINDQIRSKELTGSRLITIEALNVVANGEWRIDTELSVADESVRHVTIIRVFYESSVGGVGGDNGLFNEHIGIADFTPHHLSGGSLFKRPHFESFSSIIDRASQWLSDNPEINFLNAQSIDIKLKSLTKVDTRVCSHTEHGDYIHILRVAYTKPFEHLLGGQTSADNTSNSSRTADNQSIGWPTGPPPPAPIYLSSKVFLVSKQDILDDVHHKINNWVKDSSQMDERFKSRIMSAETVQVFAKDGDDRNLCRALEQTFQCNRLGLMNTFAFNAIRVYFDVGFYGRNRSMSTMPTVPLVPIGPVAGLPSSSAVLLANCDDNSITGATAASGSPYEYRSRSTSCTCM